MSKWAELQVVVTFSRRYGLCIIIIMPRAVVKVGAGWHHRDLLCCVTISHDNRVALIDMAVILLPKNHRIEYGEELSERFKAENRSTVTAVKYTQIDKHLLVRGI